MSVSTIIKAIILFLSCSLLWLTGWKETSSMNVKFSSPSTWEAFISWISMASSLVCVIIFLPLLWISCTETSLNRGVELYFCIVCCVFLFVSGISNIDTSLHPGWLLSDQAWNLVTAIGSLAVITGLFVFGYIIYSCFSKTPRQSVHNSP